MELEDIVDKYKTAASHIKVALILALGLLPSLYIWTEEGDRLELDLQDANSQLAVAQTQYSNARSKVDRLPQLLTRINEIELELDKAKNVLPDQVEIDKLLSLLGTMEEQFNIRLINFKPNEVQRPRPDLEYSELPIELVLQGNFKQVMQFYDSLVHLPNLTHLREIQINRQDTAGATTEARDGDQTIVNSQAKLILFRGDS